MQVLTTDFPKALGQIYRSKIEHTHYAILSTCMCLIDCNSLNSLMFCQDRDQICA